MPDPAQTPGAVRPGVGADELCRPDYEATVAPPPAARVDDVFDAYGVAGDERAGYVIDHLVPVHLGGTADRENLWPLTRSGSMNAELKSRIEALLVDGVCSGQVRLAAAQRAIAANWPIAYPAAGGLPPLPVAVPVPGPTAPPAPTLTPAQNDEILAAVRADPGVAHLLVQGRARDEVGPIYGTDQDLLGGAVRIVFDPPADVVFEAPVEGCIDGRRRRVLRRVDAEGVTGVAVMVFLADGAQVERASVEPSRLPGPQATVRETTVRELQPPGARCRPAPSSD